MFIKWAVLIWSYNMNRFSIWKVEISSARLLSWTRSDESWRRTAQKLTRPLKRSMVTLSPRAFISLTVMEQGISYVFKFCNQISLWKRANSKPLCKTCTIYLPLRCLYPRKSGVFYGSMAHLSMKLCNPIYVLRKFIELLLISRVTYQEDEKRFCSYIKQQWRNFTEFSIV